MGGITLDGRDGGQKYMQVDFMSKDGRAMTQPVQLERSDMVGRCKLKSVDPLLEEEEFFRFYENIRTTRKDKRGSLKAPGFNPRTYAVKNLVSNFAFEFNLYRYDMVPKAQGGSDVMGNVKNFIIAVFIILAVVFGGGLYKLTNAVNP
jgi:hypothetical protein